MAALWGGRLARCEVCIPSLRSGQALRAESEAETPMRKIPIGVFDPVYDHLSLDEMLKRFSTTWPRPNR